MNCDGHGRHPLTRVTLSERPAHGCYKCCSACNLDAHRCIGCGDQINHGVGMCLRCWNRKD